MNKKQIVFYCASSPTIMIYKIAKVLKKEGYSTVLFAMCEKNLFDYDFYKNAFDKIICSNFQFFKVDSKYIKYFFRRFFSLSKFLISLKFSNPGLVIGTLGGNWQIKLLRKYFFPKTPFVYFPYDILSHSFSNKDEALKSGVKDFEIEAEKYCFENCDGVIHKGNPKELKVLEGRLHKSIKFPIHQLSFFPYCSEEFFPKEYQEKLSKNKNEMHFVFPGFLPNDPILMKKLIFIFKEFSKQKIHIHIYAIVDHISKKDESEYIKKMMKNFSDNPFVHLHNSLNAVDIISEMTKYDFGFMISNDKNPKNLEPKLCTGNKIASFLEAGIPMVSEESLEFMGEIIKKYEIGILFNQENVKEIRKRISKENPKKISKKIELAKKDYDMNKNFPRLKSFIESVMNNNKE